ncbi:hypothetical protein [Gabonibacter chumensis]|uniref:hypothetical protein n=1 Tax=Gabonibacter chumensis TaxID=2972474 RepID=UPI0025745489|nr:hypothetical protein [Gabonibacter chumensis]MCR9011011.1 hypothetical protein [Gabonibacter chumensis]
MKKTIQFVVVTLILLVGGVLTGMAQNQVIYRTRVCNPGETFHVSFFGVFDGSRYVKLCIKKSSGNLEYRNLGKVSAFTLCCVTAEDEAEYWFGQDTIQGGSTIFKYKLCVTLTVSGPPMAVITGKADHLKMNEVSNPFDQLICTRTKSLIWRSKMLVLA